MPTLTLWKIVDPPEPNAFQLVHEYSPTAFTITSYQVMKCYSDNKKLVTLDLQYATDSFDDQMQALDLAHDTFNKATGDE